MPSEQTTKANDSVKSSFNIYSKLVKPFVLNSSNLLTLMLVTLNFFGADIPWLWVFAPIWMLYAFGISLVLLVVIFYLLAGFAALFVTICADLIDKYILPILYKKEV